MTGDGIAVIGGGAAGMFAALTAARRGADVTLFEKNGVLGKKLRITGKGRCNLTNDCGVEEFFANVPTNPKFLQSALRCFKPSDTMDAFERMGVKLKVERGKRVFPVSDDANEVADALAGRCAASGVKIIRGCVKDTVKTNENTWKVTTDGGEYFFGKVILCTGGLSYPSTGSTGDGYGFASRSGHKITPLSASLVPLECYGSSCARLQGLTLKNIGLKVLRKRDGAAVFDGFGEMLFTHFGISGPLVLSASANMTDEKYTAVTDLKPALDFETLDRRILSDFSKYPNRNFSNSLSDLLPSKMIDVIVGLSGTSRDKKVNSVTREERKNLLGLLKGFRLDIRGKRPVSEAIVTRGGVDVKEINPSTMESKIAKGLYFAGEIIDVDGYTGGFNLQIAFSTAVRAAVGATGTNT